MFSLSSDMHMSKGSNMWPSTHMESCTLKLQPPPDCLCSVARWAGPSSSKLVQEMTGLTPQGLEDTLYRWSSGCVELFQAQFLERQSTTPNTLFKWMWVWNFRKVNWCRTIRRFEYSDTLRPCSTFLLQSHHTHTYTRLGLCLQIESGATCGMCVSFQTLPIHRLCVWRGSFLHKVFPSSETALQLHRTAKLINNLASMCHATVRSWTKYVKLFRA